MWFSVFIGYVAEAAQTLFDIVRFVYDTGAYWGVLIIISIYMAEAGWYIDLLEKAEGMLEGWFP